MYEVSTFRLYLLRAMYLLIAAGLAILIWPLMLDSPTGAEHMRGVVWSLLTGISLIALLGIRYPLKMLPILLLEFVFKTLWLLRFGLPQSMAGRVDPQLSEDMWLIGGPAILLLFILPWGYVWRHYFREPSERWR